MNKHARRPHLVAILIIGLVLGLAASTGTADAAALTKAAVRKIAAKVVKKEAPTLSVAHAATADNASTAATLQGSTADQLKTRAYTYVLPIEPAANQHRYAFPGLPVGTYLVQYSYNAQVQGHPTIICQIELTAGADPLAAVSYGVEGVSNFNRASASAVITTTPTTDLWCAATGVGTFNMVASNVVEETVSFIPIDLASRTGANSSPKPGPDPATTGATGMR